MPKIEFRAMPSSARVWVFGAAAPVTGAARDTLIEAVDAHLAQWAAHGTPLVCAREFRDDQFLAVAVDEAATGASGCSIDGLFRVLTRLEHQLGTSMVDGGSVFWRDANGGVQSSDRATFKSRAVAGAVGPDTPVFDTMVDTVGAWRERFEGAARQSWHARLIGL
jgi:hypothetical protein